MMFVFDERGELPGNVQSDKHEQSTFLINQVLCVVVRKISVSPQRFQRQGLTFSVGDWLRRKEGRREGGADTTGVS